MREERERGRKDERNLEINKKIEKQRQRIRLYSTLCTKKHQHIHNTNTHITPLLSTLYT